MSNLLSANFYRLWRSKVFWGCAAVTFAVTLGVICLSFGINSNPTSHWDQEILMDFSVPMFTTAAFATVFIGSEYSENTIRNKLTVGKTRAQIYFANLITVTAGGLIITAAGQLAPTAVALYTGGEGIEMSANSFAVGIFVCICAVIGSCAFFTLVGMNVTRMSLAVVLALILMIGANTAVPKLEELLDRPLNMTVTQYNKFGEVEKIYEEPNPDAVTGFARTLVETAYNILPFGAVEQSKRDTETRGFLPLYAVGGFAAMTCIGALAFRKKDLK